MDLLRTIIQHVSHMLERSEAHSHCCNDIVGHWLMSSVQKAAVDREKTWRQNFRPRPGHFGLCLCHFFLAASRLGADTLTLPGMFLDRSVSWNTR